MITNMRTLSRIIIHHSASPRETTTLEDIRGWHKSRGFTDIGYHYIIEGDGTIREGRPINTVGAHCRGHNRTSIGICVVGNNLEAEHKWTGSQVMRLRLLLGRLKDECGTLAIVGHRDVPGAVTLCPGLDVRTLLGLGD